MVAIFRGSTGNYATQLQIVSSYTLMEMKMFNHTLITHTLSMYYQLKKVI